MKVLKNERGLSLVELLAALAITVVIGLIAYGILFNGFKTYERVRIEADLRDEADLIMAELLSDLFVLKTSETVQPSSIPSSIKYIKLTDGGKLGFDDGRVHLKDGSEYTIQNDSIKINDDTQIIVKEQGQYEIILSLEWTETNQTLTTTSEIGIITDNE